MHWRGRFLRLGLWGAARSAHVGPSPQADPASPAARERSAPRRPEQEHGHRVRLSVREAQAGRQRLNFTAARAADAGRSPVLPASARPRNRMRNHAAPRGAAPWAPAPSDAASQ